MADDVRSRLPNPRRSRGTDAGPACAPAMDPAIARAARARPDVPTAATAGSPGT